jgi:hypothetical protein
MLCPRCRIADRSVSSSGKINPYCKPCARARTKEWRSENPERVKEKNIAWAKENPERVKELNKKWHKNNADRHARRHRDWRERNLEEQLEKEKAYREANREKRTEYDKIRRQQNPEYFRAADARRRAAEQRAFPAWADSKAMLAIYVEAERISQETGIPYDVDHIVPLTSKRVCGLHCEANLQIIPASENRSKSNRHWPDE